MPTRMHNESADRVTGAICLDFVNTAAWDPYGEPGERLSRYRDLVRWSRDAGLLSLDQSAAILEAAERQPDAAAAELEHALQARTVMREVFHELATQNRPRPAGLQTISNEVAIAFGSARMVDRGGVIVRDWGADRDDLGQVLRPIVADAGELLLSDRVGRLRECANERCGWLFLDDSRNGTRRWCDMRLCGNRAKARRSYERRVALSS